MKHVVDLNIICDLIIMVTYIIMVLISFEDFDTIIIFKYDKPHICPTLVQAMKHGWVIWLLKKSAHSSVWLLNKHWFQVQAEIYPKFLH